MGSGMQRAMSWFQYVVSSVWGLYVFITRTALAMLQVGVHQRVPVILGSAEDVEECLGPWSFGVTDSYWHTWRWRFELMPSLQILNNVSHLEMVVFSTSKISFKHLLYHVVLCHMQISRSRTQQGDVFSRCKKFFDESNDPALKAPGTDEDPRSSGKCSEHLGFFPFPECTLWLFNIAMKNGPFIDGLPIKNCDFPWLC